jgi:hypothetical protein
MAKFSVRVKTSPPIFVIEREVIVLVADAIIAPANPAKITTINITNAGTWCRKRFIFFKPCSFLLFAYTDSDYDSDYEQEEINGL